MEHTIKYSLLYNILCLHMNLVLCRSRESMQSPGGAKRRKSRAELVRQLSKQKSIVSQMVDEDMPEQTTTLIQEEKAEEGVVGFTINSFFLSLFLSGFPASSFLLLCYNTFKWLNNTRVERTRA